MATKITRLNRESDPPPGKPASATPQYWDRESEDVEDVEGLKGAPFSMLVGPDGEPIDDGNPLEARVRLLETLIGPLNASKETNPDASSAALLALVRGQLALIATLKAEIDKLTALIDNSRLKTEATLTGQLPSIRALNPNFDDLQPEGPGNERYVELTAIQDDNGAWILRTVDAAPFAYNLERDAIRVLNVSEQFVHIPELDLTSVTLAPTEGANTPWISTSPYKEFLVHVDAGATVSPLDLRAFYGLPPNGTTNIFIETIIDEPGGAGHRGFVARFTPKGLRLTLRLRNNATANRTCTMRVYGVPA